MNAAVLMESCPDHETLSAFIDQQLDPKSRLDVVKHLAECGDCRDLVVAASEFRKADAAESATVRRGRFGSRWAVPLAAAAAVVMVFFGVTSIRERGSGMPALVEAARSMPERTTAARLSADFAYKGHRSLRGNEDQHAADQVSLAVLQAEQRAVADPNAANLHAAGVAGILDIAEKKDPNKAVDALQRAATLGEPSAEVLSDLSAAYIARGGKGDYERALDAANKALALGKTPAAAWNRALSLEYLGRDKDAVRAWQQYLELDPDSKWAEEARRKHLELLQSFAPASASP